MAQGDPLPANAVLSPPVDVTIAAAPVLAQPSASVITEPFQGGPDTISGSVSGLADGSNVELFSGPKGGPYTDTGLSAVVNQGTYAFQLNVPANTTAVDEIEEYVVAYIPPAAAPSGPA